MNLRNEAGLTYDDVLLVPKLGLVESRSEVSTDTQLTNSIPLRIPIVAAPMSSVVDSRVAVRMGDMGGGAFIHRNQSVESQIDQWMLSQHKTVGCAVGITESVGDRFMPLYAAGCKLFCLDIAHAHSEHTERWLTKIPEHILESVDFVFGSIATGEAVEWFQERFPVGAFRVGIGPGAACTTREKTGHGFPQLSAVAECVDASDHPIIADGGINTSGDIVKALAAGASSVMLGRLLAGAEEAPHPGSYYGMASDRAKKETGYSNGFTEGVEARIPVVGPLEGIINDLMNGIKSGISYAGGRNIEELHWNHEFICVSAGSAKESGVRVESF